MSILIEFFASTLGKWAIIVILLGATFTTGYIKGEAHEQEQEKIAETKVLVKTKIISNIVEKEVVKNVDKVKTLYIPIDQEIEKYVKLNKDSNVVVDNQFIWMLQQSTTNPITRSTPNINETNSRFESDTSTTTTGQIIQVINENNKLYYECKTIVESWQDFYSKVQKEYNEN